MKSEWNDLVNPLTVKELRQNINSNLVKYGCTILALGLFYTVLMFCGKDHAFVWEDQTLKSTMEFGKILFYAGTGVMAAGSVVFGGVLGMWRFCRERSVPELDVGNFTSMSPLRMVWGRLLAMIVMTVYVYSICLPCTVCAYFLNGLTLESILMTHLYVLIMVMTLNLAMLWLGAQGKMGGCIAVLVLGSFCSIGPGLPFIYFIGKGDFSAPWIIAVMVFLVILGGVFFLGAVCDLSAPLSNRLLPLKVYLSVAAFLLLGTALLLYGDVSQKEFCIAQWITLGGTMFFALALALIGIRSPENVSIRVRENCPDNIILRVVHYLFSGVWGGGYLLGNVIMAFIWLISVRRFPEIAEHTVFLPLFNMVGYMMFYIVLTQVMHLVLPRLARTHIQTGIILVFNLLPGLVWLGMLLVNAALNQGDWANAMTWWKGLMCLSVFRYCPEMANGMVFSSRSDEFLNLIGVWLGGISVLVAIPMIVEQFKGFKKPTSEEWNRLLTPQEKE